MRGTRRSLVAAAGATLTLALAVPSVAAAGDITLHPNGFGAHTYAAWKAKQGEKDRTGTANQALYLQKDVATDVFAAAVARFNGVEGMDVADVFPLAFDRRLDGYCGAGAPRFNLTYAPSMGGPNQTLFFGCQAMAKSQAQEPNFERRTQEAPMGVEGTVVSLAIVQDEMGSTWLDNIQVGRHIWTSAADNGNNNG